MIKRILFFALIFLVNNQILFSQIDNEANFYTDVSNANFNKNLVLDYSVDNDFTTDDSPKLQTAIDNISSNGGGILTISAGNYSFGNINLKSNVHLKIHKDVVIRPFYEILTDGKLKNYAIFKLGANTNPVQNISISSISGDRFTIDLTQNNNPNVAVVNCQKVTNFLIANFNVLDNCSESKSPFTKKSCAPILTAFNPNSLAAKPVNTITLISGNFKRSVSNVMKPLLSGRLRSSNTAE